MLILFLFWASVLKINNTFIISVYLILYFDSDLPQLLHEITLQLLQPETQKGYDFLVSKDRIYS